MTIKEWWLLKFRQKEVAENKKSWAIPLAAVGLIVIVAGIVLETYCEGKVADAETELRNHFSTKLSAAEEDAAEATRDAGTAKDSAKEAGLSSESAKAKADAAKLSADGAVTKANAVGKRVNVIGGRIDTALRTLDELDAKAKEINRVLDSVGPRSLLLLKNRSVFTDALKQYVSQPFIIQMCSQPMQPVSSDEKFKISMFLDNASWMENTTFGRTNDGCLGMDGITVVTALNAPSGAIKAAAALEKQLEALPPQAMPILHPLSASDTNFLLRDTNPSTEPFRFLIKNPSFLFIEIGDKPRSLPQDMVPAAKKPK